MKAINTALQGLTIGEPQAFRNLAAIPLILHNAPKARYITLAKAVTGGLASITEISEGGSVPQLMLENIGKDNVLVLDGEELIGAKQNRIANLTVLAAAHAKTVLPVSCVEQGRWNYASEEFSAAPRAQFSRGRAEKTAALSSNLRSAGTYAADQGGVWDSIAAKQDRMQVHSPTGAMKDIYEQHHDGVEAYAMAFTALDEQIGILVAIDGEVRGMDLFDAPDTLEKTLAKIVRSFAIDALESAKAGMQQNSVEKANRFLDRVAAADTEVYSGISLGRDVRLSAPLIAGGAFVHDQRLIHLATFAMQSAPEKGRGGAKGSHWWQ